MRWNELQSDIGKMAPLLADLIATDAGPLIGAAIAGVLHVPPNPSAVSDKLNSAYNSYTMLYMLEESNRATLEKLNAEIIA